MHGLQAEARELDSLRTKLIYLACRRYRLHLADAEDVVQSAIATWCEVRHRYPPADNSAAILTGIFRNKCREHVDRLVREQKRTAPPHATEPGQGAGRGAESASVLDQVVRRERSHLILKALSRLRPEAAETFELLIDEDVGRKGMIERWQMNKNTLDSRLHLYRKELRQLLRDQGVTP